MMTQPKEGPRPTSGSKAIKLFAGVVLGVALLALSETIDTRQLSINLGGGACQWTAPDHDIPNDIDWITTLVVGFPSGDKRLAFKHLEGLTGWAARDEWAYKTFGMSNHPFIKTNYPHYDGDWGWEDAADQSILIVRNIRNTFTEFHHVMWDLGAPKTYAEALEHEYDLYDNLPPQEHFLSWRDEHVYDEISFYGWFIDYWMEGGILRDVYSHDLVDGDTWYMNYSPDHFHELEGAYGGYDEVVAQAGGLPAYDERCANLVSGGCVPLAVISAERFESPTTGPAEAAKMGAVLEGKRGISDYLIEKEAWGCVWEELIINRKGEKTFLDREGHSRRNYNFSEEFLNEMLREIYRLIIKYGSKTWQQQQIAKDLVSILNNHKAALEQEIVEVQNGLRKLTENDFLGPKTRRRMEMEKLQLSNAQEARDLKQRADYKEFFDVLEKKMMEKRIFQKRRAVVREQRVIDRKLKRLGDFPLF